MQEHISIMISRQTFKLAGVLSFAAAIFQAVISFSPSWSLYFGAPEKLVTNMPMLYATGLIATIIFFVFGLYALAGAGYIRPMPYLRFMLIVIGSVYTLRGLFIVPLLLGMMEITVSSEPLPPPWLVTSVFSLCVGILYLTSTLMRWRQLSEVSKNRYEVKT